MSVDIPVSYEFINQYQGTLTPTGEVEFDLTTNYFFRSLYQRALSVIKFDLPKEWNKRYFKNVLFGCGYIGIVRTAKFGVVPQISNISGYGLYLQPTKLLVSQPFVNFEGTIGENCAVIKLTPDYKGIIDIVEHYAIQLSKCYTSINVSLVNSRVSMLAYAKSKQGAETLKMILEKISSGEPAVVTDKIVKGDDLNGTESIFTSAFDPARNYITDKLLTDFTTILNSFDREIGIPVIDEKKERRIESEISTIISDTGTRLETWTECLDESIEECKRVFPEIEISYKTQFDVVKGVQNVTNSAININRSV